MGKIEGQSYDRSAGTMMMDNLEIIQKVFRYKIGFAKKSVTVDGICRKGYCRIVHDYRNGRVLTERELSNKESKPYWPVKEK